MTELRSWEHFTLQYTEPSGRYTTPFWIARSASDNVADGLTPIDALANLVVDMSQEITKLRSQLDAKSSRKSDQTR